jgi:hypothetical protein
MVILVSMEGQPQKDRKEKAQADPAAGTRLLRGVTA